MGIDDEIAETVANAEAGHRIAALVAYLADHPHADLVAVVYESEEDSNDGEPAYEVFFDTDHARAVGMLTTAATDLAHAILYGADEGDE